MTKYKIGDIINLTPYNITLKEKTMQIHGFQKMTLLDYPGKVAATLFTAGCNLRCPFCHNAPLVTKINLADCLDTDEILAYLKKRQGILDGVCVTGGEPLLSDGIFELLDKLKSLGYSVKLDTNGTFPERLRRAVFGGLVDTVAMDIKNSRERYAETVGMKTFDLAPVEESVEFLKSGAVDFEFRTTVVNELHTEADMTKIGEWICGAPRYYLQRFKDSGNLISQGFSEPSIEVMKKLQEIAKNYVQNVELRGVD